MKSLMTANISSVALTFRNRLRHAMNISGAIGWGNKAGLTEIAYLHAINTYPAKKLTNHNI